jgi:Zn-finger nucleic acid-binding protein
VSIYRQGPSPAGSCPRCRESLLAVDAAPGVKTCEKCGGVFADNPASQRIVTKLDKTLLEIGFTARIGREPATKDTGRPLTCPECLVAMRKVRIESACCEIDVCAAHGTWFDSGELQDVMRAYARNRRGRGSLLGFATDPPDH